MTGPVVVRVPIALVSPNRLHAEHWGDRRRRVRAEREAVVEALRGYAPPPLPVLVTIALVQPRRLDDDNATTAAKAPRDAVAGWLGVDDGDPRVRFRVDQRRGRPGERALEVEVAHVADPGERRA